MQMVAVMQNLRHAQHDRRRGAAVNASSWALRKNRFHGDFVCLQLFLLSLRDRNQPQQVQRIASERGQWDGPAATELVVGDEQRG